MFCFLDSQNALKLHLFPALIPTKARKRIANKKNWKPSIQESRNGLFIHIKNPGDLEETQKRRVDVMFDKGLTVQPYVVLIGPNLGNIVSALVIINNKQYKCQSVLDALDFCFKAYQVLDAKYPFECEHLWYLIQWAMYGYKTASDPVLPLLNEFL